MKLFDLNIYLILKHQFFSLPFNVKIWLLNGCKTIMLPSAKSVANKNSYQTSFHIIMGVLLKQDTMIQHVTCDDS